MTSRARKKPTRMLVEELEPRTFSFNSPYGVCPECEGLGVKEEFDPELVAPDLALSLSAKPMRPPNQSRSMLTRRTSSATG